MDKEDIRKKYLEISNSPFSQILKDADEFFEWYEGEDNEISKVLEGKAKKGVMAWICYVLGIHKWKVGVGCIRVLR
jgi:hypothetical protein